jgi:hypothetical protein
VHSAGRYGNNNSKCEIFYVGTSRDFIVSTNSNTVQPRECRNHALSSGLMWSSVSLNKWFNLFRVWDWGGVYLYFPSVPACILRLDWYTYTQILVGADKSLARPSSRMSRDGIDYFVGKRGVFMCPIASIFLLQRLKGSMSGDGRDLNNIETRSVINFFFCNARRRRKLTPFW